MTDEKQLAAQVERLKGLFAQLGRMAPLRDPLASLSRYEELQMTPAKMHVIMWLGLEGPLPMGVLAHRACTTLPNCTRTVDSLKKAGLVLRERAATDRRVVLARLSAKGARLHHHLETMMTRRLSLFLSALPGADRSALIDILERLVDRFAGAAEGAPPVAMEDA